MKPSSLSQIFFRFLCRRFTGPSVFLFLVFYSVGLSWRGTSPRRKSLLGGPLGLIPLPEVIEPVLPEVPVEELETCFIPSADI